MLISVTQDHIEEARTILREKCPWKPRCSFCPVALALREATGKDWKVMGKSVWFRTGKLTFLSRRCRAWIERFDNYMDVRPFTFRFNNEGVR